MNDKMIRFLMNNQMDDIEQNGMDTIGIVQFRVYRDHETKRFFVFRDSQLKCNDDYPREESIGIYAEIIKDATDEINYVLSEDFVEDYLAEKLEAENENQTVQ